MVGCARMGAMAGGAPSAGSGRKGRALILACGALLGGLLAAPEERDELVEPAVERRVGP
jgi:hypothetical protein